MADLEELERLARAATQGEWRSRACGGHSVVLSSVAPDRNDTRAKVGYGYDPRNGHSLAYPFVDDGGQVHFDFTCFAHGDAAYIAAAQPRAILALIEERKRLRAALETIATGPGDSISGHLPAAQCRHVARAALEGEKP